MPDTNLTMVHSGVASGEWMPAPGEQVYTIVCVATDSAGRLPYWNFSGGPLWLQIVDEPYNPNGGEAVKVFRRGSMFAPLGYVRESDVPLVRQLGSAGYVPVAYDGDPSTGFVRLYLAKLVPKE